MIKKILIVVTLVVMISLKCNSISIELQNLIIILFVIRISITLNENYYQLLLTFEIFISTVFAQF